MGYKSKGSEIEIIFKTRIESSGDLLIGQPTLMGYAVEDRLILDAKKPVLFSIERANDTVAQRAERQFGRRMVWKNTGNERIVGN